MIALTLARTSADDYGTFGELLRSNASRICVTCELPDCANPTGHVRIPAGTYRCVRRDSVKHKCEVFEITGVPGRTDIEIHAANFPSDLLGCCAVGATVEHIDGKLGVTNSRNTFAVFMDEMSGINDFTLDVIDPPGAP